MRDKRGLGPLCATAVWDSWPVSARLAAMKMLFEHGAKPNEGDVCEVIIVLRESRRPHLMVPVLEALLERWTVPDSLVLSGLCGCGLLSRLGPSDRARLLLAHVSDPNAEVNGGPLLYHAIHEELPMKEVILPLIEAGARLVPPDGNLSLSCALAQARWDVAQILLDAGAVPCFESDVLHALNSPERLLESFLRRCPEAATASFDTEEDHDENESGTGDWGPPSALWQAAAVGNHRATKLLLEAGADPNGAPSPLRGAVGRSREVLLRAGADPNTRGSDGESPLGRAIKLGNLHAASVLARHGAIVDPDSAAAWVKIPRSVKKWGRVAT
jgi:ankyrin repeat protein